MSCVYIAGRSPTGTVLALETLALRTPFMASSSAALSRLVLSLGGRPALKLLASDAFVSLLRGYGTSQERLSLARSYLSLLKISYDALLSDVMLASTLSPCRYVVFSMPGLRLQVLSGERGEPPIHLRDLIAALCSLTPIPLATSVESLMDAEIVYPAEIVAAATAPAPLAAFLPYGAAAWIEDFPMLKLHIQNLTLNDRILCRRPLPLPVFRMGSRRRLQGVFGRMTEDVLRTDPESQMLLASTLLSFFLCCHLGWLSRGDPL